MTVLVHLPDSLSNLGTPLLRLIAALDRLENVQFSGGAQKAIVAQTGAVDPCLVRARDQGGLKAVACRGSGAGGCLPGWASQRKLTRRFGLHEQTVRAHLSTARRQPRPLRPLMNTQEVEVVRLYVEEMWSLVYVVTPCVLTDGETGWLGREGAGHKLEVNRSYLFTNSLVRSKKSRTVGTVSCGFIRK